MKKCSSALIERVPVEEITRRTEAIIDRTEVIGSKNGLEICKKAGLKMVEKIIATDAARKNKKETSTQILV